LCIATNELGHMLGIALMLTIVAGLISTVSLVLGFARGSLSDNLVASQNSMDSLQLVQFEDFDNKVVSGSQVNSALSLFSGRNLGLVVVNTRPNRNSNNAGPTSEKWGQDIRWAGNIAANGSSPGTENRPKGSVPGGNNQIVSGKPPNPLTSDFYSYEGDVGILKTTGHEIGWIGFNYGALFEWRTIDQLTSSATDPPYSKPMVNRHNNMPVAVFVGEDSTASQAALVDTRGLHRNMSTSYYTANLFLRNDGSLIYNNNTAGTKKSGTDEYIRPTAKYMSRLVRDTNGDITGIVFIQTQ